MIRVYALKIDAAPGEALYQSLLTKVGPEKKAKIEKFLRQEDALRCLFADLLIRYILTQHAGLKSENISFGYTSYGKPFLKGFENTHFNVSHSGDWIVCATDDKAIGIDIEKIAPIDFEVAESSFSRKECEQLFSLSPVEQTNFFYDLWTCKESYLKLNGMGLSAPLDSFTINIEESGAVSLASETEVSQHVFFKQYDIDANYKLAICALNDSFGDVVFLSPEEISSFSFM